jgi:hypothetical protein
MREPRKTRKTRKGKKEKVATKTRKPSNSLADDSLVFQLGVEAEIDEKTEPIACGFQVVMQLGAVEITQAGQCFQFDDGLLEADEIWNVLALEPDTLVV